MQEHELIGQYFSVLAPHTDDAKATRTADWAAANQADIRNELRRVGPKIMVLSKIEVVKDSGIFTEPNAIDTTAESFFQSFGYGPGELLGKRVLDIGAFSGGMSFFAEDCGATVVALDIQRPQTNGFALIHGLRRSTVTHVTASVYDIHPSLFGTFDVIVFSGVHYHLKHPLLALERLSAVAKAGCALLALGTAADFWIHKPGSENLGVNLAHVSQKNIPEEMSIGQLNEIPLLGFYKSAYLGDNSNWLVPNTNALADMIETSGFDVISKSTFPIYRTMMKEPMACALVFALKAREPDVEYSSDVYLHLRRFDQNEVASTTFSIPTWYELERERRARSSTHKSVAPTRRGLI